MAKAAGLEQRGWWAAVLALGRQATVIGLAGVAAGIVVAGLGGRILMRISAIAAPADASGALTDAGNRVGEVTLGGSIAFVLAVGIFSGVMGAFLYFISEPWLPSGGAHGVAFGAFLLLVASGQSDTLEPANTDFALVGNEEVVVSLFVVLFIGFGLVLALLAAHLKQRLPGATRGRASSTVYLLSLPIGVLVALGLFVAYLVDNEVETSTGFRTEPPQLFLGGLLLVLTVLTTYVRFTAREKGVAVTPPPWKALGSGLVVAAVAVGGYEAMRDIGNII